MAKDVLIIPQSAVERGFLIYEARRSLLSFTIHAQHPGWLSEPLGINLKNPTSKLYIVFNPDKVEVERLDRVSLDFPTRRARLEADETVLKVYDGGAFTAAVRKRTTSSDK